DELELLKREHLERYISSCREELIDLWDKCYYSEEQRALFNAFFITEGSDALLEEYENEIEGLKAYYTANEAMFAMVQQRQELWNKKLELEARARIPTDL
ncbi:Protein regulator of cytokinesis 1, partial [Caligus rogercresseyi]